MTEDEIYHIAVMPPTETTPDVINRVAEVVSQPDYQLRMMLAGRLPKIIGHYRDASMANVAVHSLEELKLVVFVVTESELRRPVSPGLIARSIKIESDRAVFTSRDGRIELLNNHDASLILTGRRTRLVGEVPIETSKMKVNVPGTLLTGGVPIMKRVASKTQEPQKMTEQFIRLYRKESDIPVVEIRQFDFDYSFLGEKMSLTATGNIASTVLVLRQVFNSAHLDDSMVSGFVAEPHKLSGIDPVEQNCLLLARYYRVLANSN
jgi:hypothetical protein